MKICENGIDRDMTEEEVAIYNIKPPIEIEIAQLKQNLADTDYVITKLTEGAISREKCDGLIEQRAEWRRRINELEEQMRKENMNNGNV